MHSAGESFCLIASASLMPLDLPLEALGSVIHVRANGIGDADASSTDAVVTGEVLRPPSPVHVRTSRTADGGLGLSWTRRSRVGWVWLDGVDAALGESVERYVVRLEGTASSLTVETGEAALTLTSEQLGALGFGPAQLSIVQVGDYATSRPATASLIL
jgi:hypothetical protein